MKSEAYWDQKYFDLVEAGCEPGVAARVVDAWREREQIIEPTAGCMIFIIAVLLVILLSGWAV